MKNKRKAKAFIIIAVCVILTVSVILAYKYRNRLFPSETTETSQQTETQTQTVTSDVTVTEKPTETQTESDVKNKAKTILNCPGLKGEYEPTAFEAKLFNAINEKRAEKGLSALNWNNCLHAKAKTRADETLTFFSHTRPDGRKPSTVLTDEKIEFSLFCECLAKGPKENDEGVRLLLNGLLRDENQSSAIFGKDYSYCAVSVSLDEGGNVYAAILLCNP